MVTPCCGLQALDEELPLTAALLANEAPYGADGAAGSSLPASGQVSRRVSYNSSITAGSDSRLQPALEVLHEVVLPVTILLIGVGFSVAALYVAILPLL